MPELISVTRDIASNVVAEAARQAAHAGIDHVEKVRYSAPGQYEITGWQCLGAGCPVCARLHVTFAED